MAPVKFICTLEALKYAAEIQRSIRFRYAPDVMPDLMPDAMPDAMPEDARNTGFSIVPEDAIGYDRIGQTAFVILHKDEAVAFDNVCPHRSTELDWNPGEVFDESGLYLICATHGALFEPASGLCVSGPCAKQKLRKVAVLADESGVFLM